MTARHHATLPLHCPHCGAPVTLTVEDWHQDGPVRSESWTCPYHGCGKVNAVDLPGRIVKAVARYIEPNTDARTGNG